MIPQLRFPEFTDEWQIKSLGNIFDVRDGTHESPQYFESGKPLLTSKNLKPNGTLDVENVSYISKEDFDSINKRSAVDVSDILFGMIGTIGNPVKVYSNDFAIKNVALLKQKDISSDYLIQYLRTSIISKQFYQKNAGGTQKFISLGDIRSLNIGVPARLEREKIAEFLTTVDDKISALEQKVEKLETYKRGVMQKIFARRIRFTRSNGSQYPEWETKKLLHVFDERSERGGSGKMLSVTIDSGVVPFDSLDRKDNSSSDKSNYKIVRTGDIAYNSMRMWQGASGLVTTSGIVSPAYTVITPKLEQNGKYWAYRFKSRDAINLFERWSQGLTSDTWNLKFNALSSLTFLYPCLEEQQKIADFLSVIDRKITLTTQQLEKTKEFKKGLLQRMFV